MAEHKLNNLNPPDGMFGRFIIASRKSSFCIRMIFIAYYSTMHMLISNNPSNELNYRGGN